MSAPAYKHRSPEQFGPYTVFERLGIGGMATVHRAVVRTESGVERVVALKRMLPTLADDEQFVARFVREAEVASKLRHGNIVQLYELGRVDDTLYIAMEFVEGVDLRTCLLRARDQLGPPPIEVVMSLLYELLDALDYAHTLCDEHGTPIGIVHRDISPSNLLIARYGNLKIIDFGIAKMLEHVSRSGTGMKGKAAYTSPEGLRGPVDSRADLFSVGAIAHELLTARPLFGRSGNDFHTLRNIQNMTPPRPSEFNPEVPPELNTFVLRALAKEPNMRWQSARRMRDELLRICHRYRIHPDCRVVEGWIAECEALSRPRRRTTVEPPARPAAPAPAPVARPRAAVGSEAGVHVFSPQPNASGQNGPTWMVTGQSRGGGRLVGHIGGSETRSEVRFGRPESLVDDDAPTPQHGSSLPLARLDASHLAPFGELARRPMSLREKQLLWLTLLLCAVVAALAIGFFAS